MHYLLRSHQTVTSILLTSGFRGLSIDTCHYAFVTCMHTIVHSIPASKATRLTASSLALHIQKSHLLSIFVIIHASHGIQVQMMHACSVLSHYISLGCKAWVTPGDLFLRLRHLTSNLRMTQHYVIYNAKRTRIPSIRYKDTIDNLIIRVQHVYIKLSVHRHVPKTQSIDHYRPSGDCLLGDHWQGHAECSHYLCIRGREREGRGSKRIY